MIISDLEYHMAIRFSIDEFLNSKMKSDLAIIIPDILLEYKGAVKEMKITSSRFYLNFTAGADCSPKEVAESIVRGASNRLVRLHKKIEGFDLIFKNPVYIKTGSKPSKRQLDDFFSIAATGI